jgi:hypothetical protein
MAKKAKKKTEKAPLVENPRVRAAIGRVAVAAVLALALLYLSGISALTLLVGARHVDTRAKMSDGAIQSISGEVLGTYRLDEKGAWCALRCADGAITAVLETAPAAGGTVTATGFVRVLSNEERADLLAWYEENGDYANGEALFDNVSPLYVRDGYGRFFPMLASKIMITCGMVCAAYIVLVYMGISTGKYGEDR